MLSWRFMLTFPVLKTEMHFLNLHSTLPKSAPPTTDLKQCFSMNNVFYLLQLHSYKCMSKKYNEINYCVYREHKRFWAHVSFETWFLKTVQTEKELQGFSIYSTRSLKRLSGMPFWNCTAGSSVWSKGHLRNALANIFL